MAEWIVEQLIEVVAERQWLRMTRSGVPWDRITESERKACRALVAPIVTNVLELAAEESE